MQNEIVSSLIRVLPFAGIIIGVSVALKKKKITSEQLNLNIPPVWKLFFYWIFGFLAYVILTEVILFSFGYLEVDKWNHTLLPSVIRIFGAVILAPVAEELIFRGIILDKLMKQKMNLHVAIFIQAVFFVLLHNFTYENTLSSYIGIVQSLMDASLFAYARINSKSLYTSIAMHMTGNLIATLERFLL